MGRPGSSDPAGRRGIGRDDDRLFTASTGSGPRSERARAVCSTGTRYVWAPRARSPATPTSAGRARPSNRRTGMPAEAPSRGVHGIQVGLHPPHGVRPLLIPPARRGLMPGPDPEDDAVAERVGERPRPARHRLRMARGDVRDARTDGDAVGRRREQREVREDLPRDSALGDPESGNPRRSMSVDRPRTSTARMRVEREGPHTDPSEPRPYRIVLCSHRRTLSPAPP